MAWKAATLCALSALGNNPYTHYFFLHYRGFTAAVLSKPAATITEQHPGLVAAAQTAFTPVLKLPLIAKRQDQVGACLLAHLCFSCTAIEVALPPAVLALILY